MGIVVGLNVDFPSLKDAAKPIALLGDIALDGAVLRIVILELLLLSFPPIFMYVYGFLETVHEVQKGKA